MSVLARLVNWYLANYEDGDVWDLVKIENLGNPGWIFVIYLSGTSLEGTLMAETKENLDDPLKWLVCGAGAWTDESGETDPNFRANGGPLALERMIEIFLDWVETHPAACV